MAYVTEIDIFDAQYKDNNLSNARIWPPHHSGLWEGTLECTYMTPLTIRVCGRRPHAGGGVICARMMGKCKIKHLAYIYENHAR